ncbi:DNA polymerase III subunit gamma and tau, partial [Streptomyces sp. NPDC054847]
EPARRPGGWPTASAPGQGAPQPAAPAPAPAPAQAAPAAPGPGLAQGAGQVRNMWPEILEAVKNRRRFTWILLSQNAQVTGFDGTTLQLGFINAGARDNFASSGSEEVLKQALAEQFNVQWKVEAIVDPSGGSGGPGGSAPPSGGPGGYGNQGGYGQGRPQPAAPASPPAPAPAAPAPQYDRAPSQPSHQASAAPVPQSSPEPPRPSEQYAPPPVSIEDDVPEADDPDLVDSALSGHDLIVRELGATVVEEYTNE